MLKFINEEELCDDRKKSEDFFDVPHMKRKSSSFGSMPKRWILSDLEKQHKKISKISVVTPNDKIIDTKEKPIKSLYINIFIIILMLICLSITLIFLLIIAMNLTNSSSEILTKSMILDIIEKKKP